MADDIARVEVPERSATRPPDQLPVPRQELQARLERLDYKHPSSPQFETADRGQPTGVEDSDQAGFDRAHDGGADGSVPEASRAAADASRESGWQAPGVRDHPDRPDPDEVHLPPDRAEHILTGDGPDAVSGGHRNGTGIQGKTEFPADWSDDMIISTVQEVARSPDVAHWQEFNSRWQVRGERGGVAVTAVVLSDGRIWTAWPELGSVGVTRNPEV